MDSIVCWQWLSGAKCNNEPVCLSLRPKFVNTRPFLRLHRQQLQHNLARPAGNAVLLRQSASGFFKTSVQHLFNARYGAITTAVLTRFFFTFATETVERHFFSRFWISSLLAHQHQEMYYPNYPVFPWWDHFARTKPLLEFFLSESAGDKWD